MCYLFEEGSLDRTASAFKQLMFFNPIEAFPFLLSISVPGGNDLPFVFL